MRERIESELDVDRRGRRERPPTAPVDPHRVLAEARAFVALGRSGAYLCGDHRVSPRERTRWRFTFRGLVTDAQAAVQSDEVSDAEAAVEELIDFACEMGRFDYFRSEDPVEAARFVVSDVVALLWGKVRERDGFAAFAERAAPQLIRWEAAHGWTRTGWGRVSEQERSLASVLAPMLPTTDMWIGFVDRYLDALDGVALHETAAPRRASRPGRGGEERTRNLAEWHQLVLDRLRDSDAQDRLDRLVTHPALGGPERTFLQARLAHVHGDLSGAHDLVHSSLETLPGHADFLDFATAIGAPLPPQAERIARDRHSTSERVG